MRHSLAISIVILNLLPFSPTQNFASAAEPSLIERVSSGAHDWMHRDLVAKRELRDALRERLQDSESHLDWKTRMDLQTQRLKNYGLHLVEHGRLTERYAKAFLTPDKLPAKAKMLRSLIEQDSARGAVTDHDPRLMSIIAMQDLLPNGQALADVAKALEKANASYDRAIQARATPADATSAARASYALLLREDSSLDARLNDAVLYQLGLEGPHARYEDEKAHRLLREEALPGVKERVTEWLGVGETASAPEAGTPAAFRQSLALDLFRRQPGLRAMLEAGDEPAQQVALAIFAAQAKLLGRELENGGQLDFSLEGAFRYRPRVAVSRDRTTPRDYAPGPVGKPLTELVAKLLPAREASPVKDASPKISEAERLVDAALDDADEARFANLARQWLQAGNGTPPAGSQLERRAKLLQAAESHDPVALAALQAQPASRAQLLHSVAAMQDLPRNVTAKYAPHPKTEAPALLQTDARNASTQFLNQAVLSADDARVLREGRAWLKGEQFGGTNAAPAARQQLLQELEAYDPDQLARLQADPQRMRELIAAVQATQEMLARTPIQRGALNSDLEFLADAGLGARPRLDASAPNAAITLINAALAQADDRELLPKALTWLESPSPGPAALVDQERDHHWRLNLLQSTEWQRDTEGQGGARSTQPRLSSESLSKLQPENAAFLRALILSVHDAEVAYEDDSANGSTISARTDAWPKRIQNLMRGMEKRGFNLLTISKLN